MSLRKKRKIEHDNITQSVPDINAEVELEIKIKQRLAATLESRITWAIALQEALEKEHEKGVTSGAFKYAALDALSAIEAPLNILYDHEPPAPPNVQLQQARLSRPLPKPKPPLFRNKASFLYIKPSAIDFIPLDGGSHIPAYLLKCPVCARTTFTSLQGLLNHARISHGLEWGTHDECVRACAVVDPSIDVDAGIEVRLGSGGILPGLRSIFQMATGSQAQPKNDDKTHGTTSERSPDPSCTSNFFSRTLGVHEDTPALAPFLGKEPFRRGIKVWNPEEDVDIDSLPAETNITSTKRVEKRSSAWRMRFLHRNAVSGCSDTNRSPLLSRESIPPDAGEESLNKDPEAKMINLKELAPSTSSGSRFYFTARVSITDRSLSLPKDIQSNYTHKWMISVESPSYSQNITTILQGMIVTCASGYEVDVMTAYNANEPPFVSVGLASRPFCARIELLFNRAAGDMSDNQHQRAIVEHWIELDPVNMCSVVVGEEQVVDIELDKRTEIKPRRTGYAPISSKVFWDLVDPEVTQQPLQQNLNGDLARPKKLKTSIAPAYEKVLATLIPRFPLTQDLKEGKSANVPYKLASSLKEFNSFIIGRRKAIQWGRAKALQEAYSQSAENGNHEGAIALSTADIYTWLAENEHRSLEIDPPAKPVFVHVKPEPDTEHTEDDIPRECWCRVCGLNVHSHIAASIVKQENRANELRSEGKQEEKKHGLFDQECIIAPRELQILKLPPIDIRHVPTDVPHVPIRRQSSDVRFCSYDLVTMADPRLTLGVRDVIGSLKLPHFRREQSLGNALIQYPVDDLGGCRNEIEQELGPHALLAILTKQLLGKLVKGGLEVAKRDAVAGSSYSGGGRKKGKRDDGVKVLTPVHILSSVLSRGLGRTHRQEETDKAVLWCLSRLGVPLDSEEKSWNLEQNAGFRDSEEERVKVEE